MLPPATPGGGRSDAVKELEAMIAGEAKTIVGRQPAKQQPGSHHFPQEQVPHEREDHRRHQHSRLSNSVDSLGAR